MMAQDLGGEEADKKEREKRLKVFLWVVMGRGWTYIRDLVIGPCVLTVKTSVNSSQFECHYK